eukprot:gene9290-10377_t
MSDPVLPQCEPPPRPKPRSRGILTVAMDSNNAPPADSQQKDGPLVTVEGQDSSDSDTGYDNFDGEVAPPIPTRQGRKPLETEKRVKIRNRRRPQNLKEKPTRPPPPTPGNFINQTLYAADESGPSSHGAPEENNVTYETFSNSSAASEHRISQLMQIESQSDYYVQPVDPASSDESNILAPSTEKDMSFPAQAVTSLEEAPEEEDDVTNVKKETEEHFTSAANEDADVFEENPVENDGGHSDNTVNKETAVDDEPIKQPAAPSPYKTESEDINASISDVGNVQKMKKKRSWGNLFSRRSKGAEAAEEEEYLNRVNREGTLIGTATSSINLAKPPSAYYLQLISEEKLDILEMTDCPSGIVGLVNTKDVTLDANSIRGLLDAIPKPNRRDISAEGLPIETLPSSAGINILPTEECQIKAKQASEATQRLINLRPGRATEETNTESTTDPDDLSKIQLNEEVDATDYHATTSEDVSPTSQPVAPPEVEKMYAEATDSSLNHRTNANDSESTYESLVDDTYAVPSDIDDYNPHSEQILPTTSRLLPNRPSRPGSDENKHSLYDSPAQESGDTVSDLRSEPNIYETGDDMYEAVNYDNVASNTIRYDPTEDKSDHSYNATEPFYVQPVEAGSNSSSIDTQHQFVEDATASEVKTLHSDEEDTYACMDDANLPSAIQDDSVYLSMELVKEDPSARVTKI